MLTRALAISLSLSHRSSSNNNNMPTTTTTKLPSQHPTNTMAAIIEDLNRNLLRDPLRDLHQPTTKPYMGLTKLSKSSDPNTMTSGRDF